MATIPEIEAKALAQLLTQSEPPILLDVREGWEFATCHVAGSRHVPLATLPGAVASLDPAATVVTICHHGVRSMHAAAFLKQQGFARVLSLAGGVDAWAATVDPGMARY